MYIIPTDNTLAKTCKENKKYGKYLEIQNDVKN